MILCFYNDYVLPYEIRFVVENKTYYYSDTQNQYRVSCYGQLAIFNIYSGICS